MPDILHALRPEEVEEARALFLEYAASLGFDLCFQGFDRELASLPGDYALPGGGLWLAREGEEAIGCVALRRFAPGIGEMKRMYVRPGHRGKGIGRGLAEVVLAEARALGYRKLRLDTIATMTVAIALYRTLGFVETAPYRANPVPGASYFELVL